jgi:RNA polymerase sigma-70 factor (ECF subfamily)
VVRLKRASKGEAGRENFALEAMEHLDHLYRVAFHLAKETDEAQDLVQETFARALASYRQFAPGTNLKAWLSKILCNFFFDRYQQAKRWVFVEGRAGEEKEAGDYWERAAIGNPGPETLLLAKELNVNVSDALKKVPPEFRAPIILVDMGDFSYVEAAEILACPLGTVRSRLFRGRRLLHEYLMEYVEAKEKK